MVYGEDDTVMEELIPLPILFQFTTKFKISDSKHISVLFHVNVILVSVALVVTTGGGG